jgi:hypothetical protein
VWVAASDEIREAAKARLKESGLAEIDRRTLSNIAAGSLHTVEVVWWRALHGLDAKRYAQLAKQLDKLLPMADPAPNPNEHERATAREKANKTLREMIAPGLMEFEGRRPGGGETRPPPSGAEDLAHEYARRRAQEAAERAAKAKAQREAAKAKRAAIRAAKLAAKEAVERREAEEARRRAAAQAKLEAEEGARQAAYKAAAEEKARLAQEALAQAAAAAANAPHRKKDARKGDRHLEPNRDRHAPGYMREYMRAWRAKKRT